VLGAVQVPADGQPLIFPADHQTTGGYPVVAVVDDADVDRCAQARSGTVVHLRLA
jgi:allophanate hydrolase subunit 2